VDFLREWLTGILHSSRTLDAWGARPAPSWGFKAVLVRFVGTSLLVALPLALLGRTPFQPSYIEFIPEEEYYKVLVFLFPLFGIITWLLMSSCAHVALRLSSHRTDFDQIANVLGICMLIPMPIVWAWDVTMIITGAYSMGTMAPSHTLFQVWETALGFVGLKRIVGLDARTALFTAVGVNLLYVLMGAFFSR
jgi:hypothetical protein